MTAPAGDHVSASDEPVQPVRVLVADDDADIRDLVEFKLAQAGYAVEAVADGASAWESFEANPPQLVVLDVMMPVLLLSAKSRDSDVDTGFAVGADDYVIKPFSPRELLHRVNGMLARAR